MKTLLIYTVKSENKWISYAINLFLKSIVSQKDLILKQIDSSSLSLQRHDSTSLLSVESKDIGKSINEQVSKLEQLKLLKEKAIHKNFFEATEGKYTGTTGEKLQLIASSCAKDHDLTTPVVQCNVLHPMPNDFNKILIANILAVENRMWQLSTGNTFKKKKPRQKLWIPNGKVFCEEISCMKKSSISFILVAFCEILKESLCHQISTSCLEELLFLLDLLYSTTHEPPSQITSDLCETVVQLVLKTNDPSITNPCLKSTTNKIVEIVLKFPSIAHKFYLQLTKLSQTTQPPINPSTTFADINLMSLKNLCETMFDENDRVMLKEIILNIDFK